MRDKVARNGLTALAIIACAVLLVVSVTQHTDWTYPAAFFALIAGIVVAILVSVEQQLAGKARLERDTRRKDQDVQRARIQETA